MNLLRVPVLVLGIGLAFILAFNIAWATGSGLHTRWIIFLATWLILISAWCFAMTKTFWRDG